MSWRHDNERRLKQAYTEGAKIGDKQRRGKRRRGEIVTFYGLANEQSMRRTTEINDERNRRSRGIVTLVTRISEFAGKVKKARGKASGKRMTGSPPPSDPPHH